MTTKVEWSADLFDAPLMERALAGWRELAAAAFADPEAPIDTLPFTAPEPAVPTLRPVADLLDAGGSVECDGERTDATGLDRRSAAVAEALRHAGVGRGDLVAVVARRDGWCVPSLLGVLRTGAAFVPLAADLTAARIDAVLAAARPAALVAPDASWAGRAAGAAFVAVDGLPADGTPRGRTSRRRDSPRTARPPTRTGGTSRATRRTRPT